MSNPFATNNNGNPFAAAPAAPAPAAFGAAPVASFGQSAGQFAPPQAAQLQPYMLQGFGAADLGIERLPPLPESGHEEVEIGEVKIDQSTNPQSAGVIYFKAELTVIKSSTCAPGTRAMFVEKLVGHKWPAKQAAARARIRGLVAAAFGLDGEAPNVRAQFDSVDPATGQPESMKILLSAQAGALKGKRVTIKSTKTKVFPANPPTFPREVSITEYVCGPLGAAVAPLTAATAPTPTPAAQTAPTFPPAGWTASVQYPGHFTGTYNGQQVTVSENDLRTAVAAGKI